MFLAKRQLGSNKTIAVLCAFLIGYSATASAKEDNLQFKVLLDNKEIGFHQFELTESDGIRTVTSKAQFDVKVLFVTAFKYRHSSLEQWQNDCVQKIETSTSSNGKRISLKGSTNEDRFELIGEDSKNGAQEQQLDGCVKTFAYWNSSILDATTLLNTQTGDYVDVTVSNLGSEQLSLDNRTEDAIKYRIQSTQEYAGQSVDITLWYSPDDMRWLALEAPAKGNRKLRYEAIASDHS